MVQGYLLFHLNLAFSSIRVVARPEVIDKCYWPLLEMADQIGIPVGVELTGWTLGQIVALDPAWVDRFRQMLANGRCELIGSGWTQLIGPLVPYEVNRWNQQLGLAAYRELLGVVPKLALVNEMAFSTGMVDVYAEAGYAGIVMDRDNVRLALGLDHTPRLATPIRALGCIDHSLPVLWSDSILFQRLQRAVHGDIPVAEYLAYIRQRAAEDGEVLPIYCNDAEIFDYRPGRFTAESRLHPEGEWRRLQRICAGLRDTMAMAWLSPSEALARQVEAGERPASRLSSISQPIPVKKQAKYNINRWAVTGRDDLWLNTACHRLHRQLVGRQDGDAEKWRELCELWASDLRTHITDDRWQDAVARVERLSGQGSAEDVPKDAVWQARSAADRGGEALPDDVRIAPDEEGILWTVSSPLVRVVLNARRGLAIKSLAFLSHQHQPVVGTLPQGYFKSIELGADFYSGGVIIELPGERTRLTDLEWIKPEIRRLGDDVLISATVPLPQGRLRKTVAVSLTEERISLRYEFDGYPRPLGMVRVGIITLLPDAFQLPLELRCVNGGPALESFRLDQPCAHGSPASAFVSSNAGFGATDGQLALVDGTGRGLTLKWDPAQCAAVPLLQYQPAHQLSFIRVSFSLVELDDTSRPGGRLLPFSVTLMPVAEPAQSPVQEKCTC
jgi:hypothetical protein